MCLLRMNRVDCLKAVVRNCSHLIRISNIFLHLPLSHTHKHTTLSLRFTFLCRSVQVKFFRIDLFIQFLLVFLEIMMKTR